MPGAGWDEKAELLSAISVQISGLELSFSTVLKVSAMEKSSEVGRLS